MDLVTLIAILLLIGWSFGFFAFNMGGFIHVLLVVAIVTLLLRLVKGVV